MRGWYDSNLGMIFNVGSVEWNSDNDELVDISSDYEIDCPDPLVPTLSKVIRKTYAIDENTGNTVEIQSYINLDQASRLELSDYFKYWSSANRLNSLTGDERTQLFAELMQYSATSSRDNQTNLIGGYY